MSVDGILLLDKPVGLTSNAALGRAKRVLGTKKAGHTGTLDPMASGLLILCFGQATKVAAFLLDADKAYEADIQLGVTTDSEDAEGGILERREVPQLDADAIEAVLARFRGDIEQVPPMHSALKHKGRRLYELARRGETVERPARPVTIRDLTLLGYEPREARLRVAVGCPKGTYIRSLARDIGQALGCGAHLAALRRTASDPFAVEDAVALDTLDDLTQEEAAALLIPPDRALEHLPSVRLDEQEASRLCQGQRLAGLNAEHVGRVRVYGPQDFLGVGEMDGQGRLRPMRLFVAG